MPTARWSSAGRATTTSPSQDYNQAITISPDYAPAYVGRGNMYRQRNQTDLALADFNAAIRLDPTDPRAFHNRGLVEQAQGQHAAAIADFSKAISTRPGRRSSPSTPAASPIWRPRTTRRPSTTSTRSSSATGIPTKAGPTRAWRWRSSASARRPSPPSPAPAPSIRSYAPAREGMRRTAGSGSAAARPGQRLNHQTHAGACLRSPDAARACGSLIDAPLPPETEKPTPAARGWALQVNGWGTIPIPPGCSYSDLTMPSVIFLASPSSMMVLSR